MVCIARNNIKLRLYGEYYSDSIFCTVIGQEGMSKPVFWHLMFKAFSCHLAIIKFISTKLSPFKVLSRTSSHKLEIQQLHITALYY